MHSFQPSRGRVFFEVLCALGMSASFAGAWLQTHATALLGAAGIAALYGLVHLFDMRRPKSAVAVEPQRVAFAPEAADIVVPMAAAVEPDAAELHGEEMDVVEAAAPRSSGSRRSGGSRKGSGRRTKAPKLAKAAEPAPVEEADVPWPMAEEADLPEPSPLAEEEFAFIPEEQATQPHIAPLFEPEPFVRMPRQAFGRRGRI